MAINVSQAFHRTSANPVDESLALTKAQMVATNDNLMPSKYLTVCQDDGKIYLYDKTNESDVTTGRFRVFEGGSTITVDPTPTENSTNAVQSGGTYTALAGKVDKVQGKGLSTEDYTTAEKTKLSGIATDAEKNTIVGITVNGDAITPDANRIAALSVLTNTVNNLLNYYNKTETYSKTEVDTLVSAVAGATFESVQTLPTTNIKTNVIYLVPKQTPETSNIKDEYINLDGTTAGWELIGDTGVDLSNYVTTTALNTALGNYTTTADLTTLLAGKVDKVSGKQLSTEDYTTAEKTKLSGLSNYDDTALSGRVSAIEGVVPSTATTSNKLATLSDVSSANGHTIEDSTGVDMTARKNLQFVGAAVSDDSTNNRTVVNVSGKADKVASAVSGNFAALDANGNLTDSGKKASDFGTASDVASKESKFRYSTIPVPSESNVGTIIQYTGATDTQSGFKNGYFYKCVAQGTDPETYAWKNVDVQPGGSGDDRIIDKIVEIGVERTEDLKEVLPYIIYKVESFNDITIEELTSIIDDYYNDVITLAKVKEDFPEGTMWRIDLPEIAAGSLGDSHVAQPIYMRVVDHNTKPLVEAINGHENALFTFDMANCLLENGGWSTYDWGTQRWRDNSRRTWCNNNFFNAIPSNIQELIKLVRHASIWIEGGKVTYNETQDKCFIMSMYEYVGGGNQPTETQCNFYKTAENRIKTQNGVAVNYATSSVQYGATGSEKAWNKLISTNGSLINGSGNGTAYPLSIAFCI